MDSTARQSIRQLSIRSMLASRSRSIISLLAIILTTLLFTALFTIALSINHSFQQANFMMVGGYSHGGFKNMTYEQAMELCDDPRIKEYGLRLFVGIPEKAPFNKSQVEVSYCNENSAKWMYLEPSIGAFPAEGTNEAATDKKVLDRLGIEPRIGSEFTLTFDVDGQETTETFVLSGWWESDEIIPASHVLIPESRAQEIFSQLGTKGKNGMTGFWTMDIMLSDTLSIEQDIESILTDHGYQNEQVNDTYIDIGVNWGYTGAQLVNSFDPMTLVAMVVLLLIIIFTGYLVIYNIFQISVSNDVRFYGLLKTIGITGRQLKRVIRIQGLTLSVLAIPLGLLAGYGVGGLLTPVILANLNGVARDAVSTSPVIFVVAALFSLFTVMFSCRKPGRMAARVSPIEAVRYAEYGGGKKRKKVEKSSRNPEKNRTANRRLDTDQQRNSLFLMALANVGRNRKKTFITLISLSLSVVLLNVTVTFVNGFDMDKYLRNMTVDLMLADAAYFQASSYWYDELAVEEDVIKALEAQDGFLAGGRTYGLTGAVQEMVTEEWIRIKMEEWMASDDLDRAIAESEKAGELIMDDAGLYGMEEFVLGKLELLDGDLSKLHEEGSRYIAAVYWSDDYGNAEPDSHWAKVGDMVTLRHVREWEMINPETGEIYGDELPEGAPFQMRAKEYQDIDYEVAATVTVPPTLSYRHFGFDEFILGDATFISDTGTSDIVYYAADTTDELGAGVEAYLRDFTEQQQTQYDYESKATYAESFESFKTMFTILGGVLSFIIGLVGILNFLNAMLTAIITRRREFAVLQAIGMTGRQLKIMLIWEGLYHTIGSVLIALILIVATAPLLGPAFGVFWFFSYRFTILPILIILPAFTLLGVLLPLISYHFAAKHSVVERLKI